MTPSQFGGAINAYCDATNGSITSGKRTTKRNTAVGGVPTSPHLVGLGADVVYDEFVTLSEAVRIAGAFGLRVIREGDHDHLQPLDWEVG